MSKPFTPDQIAQIKNIAQSVAQQTSAANYTSGAPSVPPHSHNGVSSLKINQSNIIPSARASGSIVFDHTGQYILNINGNPNPTLVLCYGTITDNNGYTFTVSLANHYTFTVSSANATAGATYGNNGQIFTVLATIAGSTTLTTEGTGAPVGSGLLAKVSGTGDSTISYSAVTTPPNITGGATYTNNGNTFVFPTNITGGTTIFGQSSGAPSIAGNLVLSSGTGDSPINFSSAVASPVPNTPTLRAHTWGSAQLGKSYEFQPSTNRSVVTGGPVQPFIQSSSYFFVDNSGDVHALTDDQHLVDVEYSGIHARLSLISFTSTQIVLNVDNLDIGWVMSLNLIII